MLTDKDIKREHSKKAPEIRKRLKEFSGTRNPDDMFVELAFCICTPQSNAKRVSTVVNRRNVDALKSASQPKLANMLRTNARFHNNKSKYIVGARKMIPHLEKLPRDTVDARDFLVDSVKGIGFKEASHFLRNVGYRDLGIIDRHVINLMGELGVFRDPRVPTSRKKYHEMEQLVRDYAEKVEIDMDELDMLLWSIRTGFVFR